MSATASTQQLPAFRRSTQALPAAARAAFPLIISLIGVALWFSSLQAVDPSGMTGLGLISVIPIHMIVALGLLTGGFVLAIFQRILWTPLLLFQLVVWIFVLHGLDAALADQPSFHVAWRHAGITEYILRNRQLDRTIDAYFNWPGFFGISALVTKLAGFESPINLIRWAPVFFNLLYLAPLTLILKSAGIERRSLWLGLWFFYSANWIGQDYFAPQALAFFAYLLVLGLLLRWFRAENTEFAGDIGWGGVNSDADRSRQIFAATVVIAVFGATVASHQLTPFAILISVGALVALRQSRLQGLPILMAVLIATWISYMTVPFLSGHMELLFGRGGADAAVANVQGRLQGSREHLLVVYARMATAALVWIVAAAGAIRARRSRRGYAPYFILSIAPFPLIVLQSYGGEMLLRIYLFVLPFCAVFIGTLLAVESSRTARRIIAACATFALSLLITGCFLVSRYGNETIDRFSSREVEAVANLYRMAPENSVLLAGTGNLPWRYRDYENYRYEILADKDLPPESDPQRVVEKIARLIKPSNGAEGFLIITARQKELVDLLGVPYPTKASRASGTRDPDWLDRLEQALVDSPKFEVVYLNEDAKIFVVGDSSEHR